MVLSSLFVSCPRGVEPLLSDEVARLGAHDAQPRAGGVEVRTDAEVMYRICLWSRLASRVLLPLTRFAVTQADDVYAAASTVPWPELFSPDRRFMVQVAGHHVAIANTHFAALRVKDAVVDSFRSAGQPRPTVDTRGADIRLHLHLAAECTLSLDLSGESLHRRGYRVAPTTAPLKENLASAILARCAWPPSPDAEASLFDPMCGSGTLVIEAALMRRDIAPGLRREHWGFSAWQGHDPALWSRVRAEAQARATLGLEPRSCTSHDFLLGSDCDPRAINAAQRNAARAGIGRFVRFTVDDALACHPSQPAGLLVCNLPYGERLGNDAQLVRLYSMFGANLRSRFTAWRCGIFTSRTDLSTRLGLRAERMHSLYNGAIDCRLLQFTIPDLPSQSDWAEDFANRLRKNQRHLQRWAQRSGVSCYRLYDADLPSYAVAVDLYQTLEDGLHAHVQEYAAPRTVDTVHVEKRLRSALATLQKVLELPPDHIHYKLRRVQRGRSQYQPQRSEPRRFTVDEKGCLLLVDFDSYLDTGLFLDHRPLRLRIRAESSGRRVLNLFCYTGAATVQAIVGGATGSVSVDLSRNYLEWALANLRANAIHAQLYSRLPRANEPLHAHALVRADVHRWLDAMCSRSNAPRFDLIFIDPPTFSNSKAMDGSFDVQRDHVPLIEQATRLLAPQGTLYFSSNRRGFRLDPLLMEKYEVTDLTTRTLDIDFGRQPPIHRCWAIRFLSLATK